MSEPQDQDRPPLPSASDPVLDAVESLANIFYLLKLQPANPAVVEHCVAWGEECVRRLAVGLRLNQNIDQKL